MDLRASLGEKGRSTDVQTRSWESGKRQIRSETTIRIFHLFPSIHSLTTESRSYQEPRGHESQLESKSRVSKHINRQWWRNKGAHGSHRAWQEQTQEATAPVSHVHGRDTPHLAWRDWPTAKLQSHSHSSHLQGQTSHSQAVSVLSDSSRGPSPVLGTARKVPK